MPSRTEVDGSGTPKSGATMWPNSTVPSFISGPSKNEALNKKKLLLTPGVGPRSVAKGGNSPETFRPLHGPENRKAKADFPASF
jgi:hypothetical protein